MSAPHLCCKVRQPQIWGNLLDCWYLSSPTWGREVERNSHPFLSYLFYCQVTWKGSLCRLLKNMAKSCCRCTRPCVNKLAGSSSTAEGTQLGTLWWPGGVGGRSKREETHVYTRLIHDVVQQKLTQHYKAIILQLKIYRWTHHRHVQRLQSRGKEAAFVFNEVKKPSPWSRQHRWEITPEQNNLWKEEESVIIMAN